MDPTHIQLFEKIITLYSWSPECLTSIEALAGTEAYCETLGALEDALLRSAEDTPLAQAEAGLADDECYALYRKVVDSAPLFRLLQAAPRLSESAPEVVITFARLADVTPDPETVLRSRDPAFMDFLRQLARSGSISVARTIIDDFTKLVRFTQTHPDVQQLIEALAAQPDWADEAARLEHKLEEPGRPAAAGEKPLAPEAQKLDHALTSLTLSAESLLTLSEHFLAEPRFSTMLPAEVLAYAAVRGSLPGVEGLISKDIVAATSPVEQYRRIAVEAIDRIDPETRTAIETGLELRQNAARHFFELRKFAKLDALAYKWPHLAQQLRLDGSGVLKTLERTVIEPEAVPANLGATWQRYLNDEHLVRFLRLRPLFRDIYQDEVTKYFTVTHAVAKPPVEMAPAAGDAAPQAPAPAVVDVGAYENLLISITADEHGALMTKVSAPGVPIDSIPSQVDLAAMEAIVRSFSATFGSPVATRGVRAAVERGVDATTHFREIGSRMFDMFLGAPSLRGPILKALGVRQRVRIALELNGPRIMALPWECLYVPEMQVFLGLIQQFSVVRHLPQTAPLIPRTLTPPLKILVASAGPKDAPPVEAREEIDTLHRALAEPLQKRQVEIHVLMPATLSELQRALRVFRPHLFHFIGHGIYSAETNKGALVLEKEDGTSMLLEPEHLRTLLMDSNISLAVLNSCDTGVSDANEVVTAVAGALVNKGIPAAIATMRTIYDAAAVMFTREFYRSFVDGYALEPALIEARKALSVEKWDWPAYALFASTLDLHTLKLIPHVRGNEPA